MGSCDLACENSDSCSAGDNDTIPCPDDEEYAQASTQDICFADGTADGGTGCIGDDRCITTCGEESTGDGCVTDEATVWFCDTTTTTTNSDPDTDGDGDGVGGVGVVTYLGGGVFCGDGSCERGVDTCDS